MQMANPLAIVCVDCDNVFEMQTLLAALWHDPIGDPVPFE